ncbi:hypothetical protein C5E16_03525 [Clavibacter michiganensis]|uniref:Peptidase S1 domain-containing protein n=2 Tax=Clavibacter michiganensis TaxID=28447 RepID=A0A2S5VWK9_9MICO|nr:hypothetical protein C5E16_03525 [Clavibacter michiganensis]
MAGTKLVSASGSACTAGAVLQYTSLYTRISQAAAATRYVLTAKHCASMRESVRLGSGVDGYVSWQSPDTDLELITVPPGSSRSESCGPTGSGPIRCSIVVQYYPRATGRVVLPSSTNGRDITPAVTRYAEPPGGEIRFCRSGAASGADCTLVTTTTPSPVSFRIPGAASATPRSGLISVGGDSGAPITSASDGFTDVTIYGILHGGGRYSEGYKDTFVRMSRFFEETSGYSLAPAR